MWHLRPTTATGLPEYGWRAGSMYAFHFSIMHNCLGIKRKYVSRQVLLAPEWNRLNKLTNCVKPHLHLGNVYWNEVCVCAWDFDHSTQRNRAALLSISYLHSFNVMLALTYARYGNAFSSEINAKNGRRKRRCGRRKQCAPLIQINFI